VIPSTQRACWRCQESVRLISIATNVAYFEFLDRQCAQFLNKRTASETCISYQPFRLPLMCTAVPSISLEDSRSITLINEQYCTEHRKSLRTAFQARFIRCAALSIALIWIRQRIHHPLSNPGAEPNDTKECDDIRCDAALSPRLTLIFRTGELITVVVIL
jgi:hypothetical protein